MAMARAWIGTSGWHYRHWLGPFYPAGTPARAFLAHYARHFDTVELNNTFYRLPGADTFAGWRDETPDGFVFACKAGRFITHMKKLRDGQHTTPPLLDAVATLGRKLGPILFQLPPRWRASPDRLDAFLGCLPAGRRYAVEFRDRSWFEPSVVEALRRHGVACCVYDLEGWTSPAVDTGDFRYLRLHGPGAAYRGGYGARALAGWARRIEDWLAAGLDVYCYFDNDDAGHAAADALRLRKRLSASGALA